MTPITAELAQLDGLIRDLDDRIDTPEGYMREHLSTARACLLEAAAEEYHLILQLVKETLPQLDRPEFVTRIRDFLDRSSKA